MTGQMLFHIAFMMVWAFSRGDWCGEPIPICHCNTDLGVLACLNTSIHQMPSFTQKEKNEVILLDIAYTNLTNIPVFNQTEWPLLQVVDLRGNARLHICHNVSDYFAGHVTLILDCGEPSLPTVHEEFDKTGRQLEVLLGSAALTPLVLVLLIVRMCMYRGRSHYGMVTPPEEPSMV